MLHFSISDLTFYSSLSSYSIVKVVSQVEAAFVSLSLLFAAQSFLPLLTLVSVPILLLLFQLLRFDLYTRRTERGLSIGTRSFSSRSTVLVPCLSNPNLLPLNHCITSYLSNHHFSKFRFFYLIYGFFSNRFSTLPKASRMSSLII